MKDISTNILINIFFKKGGYIGSVYLQRPETKARGRPSLVYLKRWYIGENTREAILKALCA